MNKFSLYILLILIFLGLSKSFSPSSIKTYFVKDINVFADNFKEENFSILLLGTFKTGLMIKTYFLKLKVINVFKTDEYFTVRTTKEKYYHYKKYLGMSLYRRSELNKEQDSNATPMPPGTLFIGNPAFGQWKFQDSGIRLWHFHRAYKNFPQRFHWGDFKATYKFYKNIKATLKNNIPFHGNQHEFGLNGSITKKEIKDDQDLDNYTKIKLKKYIKKYISTPPWKQLSKG